MNYNVYNVIQTDDICDDYRVFIDSNEVPLNTARVSAFPFNRRWPGHQRQIDQTEIIAFLSFSMNKPVKIKVIPKVASDRAVIRPQRLGIVPKKNIDGSFEFILEKPEKFTFEPYGTNHALHIFADCEKDYNIDKSDENVLYFGQGEHNVGMINMKEGQTLFIDEGAVVYATIDAFNVNNIKILGRGILDNRYNKEEILFELNAVGNDADVNNAKRTYPIEIDNCNNVEIDGITIRDPLVYNLNFVSCRNVKVNNVKLIGDWRFNSDGIHFANCVGCSLKNSFLRTYDDSICVRGVVGSEKERVSSLDYIDECKDIVIENNVIWNDWGVCFRIGAAALCKEIKKVTFKNNDIIHISASPIDALICDYADVHDFKYENVNIELDDLIKVPCLQDDDSIKYEDIKKDSGFCPAVVNLEILQHFEYSNTKYNPNGKVGLLHDFSFDNIHFFGRHDIKFRFKGYDDNHICENITFNNIFKNESKLEKKDIIIESSDYYKNIFFK